MRETGDGTGKEGAFAYKGGSSSLSSLIRSEGGNEEGKIVASWGLSYFMPFF